MAEKSRLKNWMLIIGVLMLASCKTVSGDTKTKNFHISEIVIKANFARSCVISCDKARKMKIPERLKTKLSNGLHHYAAAYNQMQPTARLGYRLEVSLIALGYENCATGVRAFHMVTGGFFKTDASIIASESKLIDPSTGATIREFTNNNQEMNILGCTVESQNKAYAKNMSKYILRRANLLKSTPKSIEESIAGIDILAPRTEPISPHSIASAPVQPVGMTN